MRARSVKPRFFLIVSLVTALIFAGGTIMVQRRMEEEAKQLSQLRLEQQALVDEIGRLQDEIEYVQTDAYVEETARDELGLINPGEIRYMQGK